VRPEFNNYPKVFEKILTEVKIIRLNDPNKIFFEFKRAYNDKESFSYLMIENADFYNDK
jgi:hypothetical protein